MSADKPTAEQECQICDDKSVVVCLDGALWLCWTCYVAEIKRRSTDIAARELAVEGAAIERAIDIVKSAGGINVDHAIAEEISQWIGTLLTPPHKAALAEHDETMLKRFEDLAGKWDKDDTWAVNKNKFCADDAMALIASIRKDRE